MPVTSLCGKAGKEGEYNMLYVLHISVLQIQGPSWTLCTENPLKDFIRAYSGETMQTTIFNYWLNLETITYSKLLSVKQPWKKRKLFQKQTATGRTRCPKHLKTCDPCIKIEKTKQSLSDLVQCLKPWLVTVGQDQAWSMNYKMQLPLHIQEIFFPMKTAPGQTKCFAASYANHLSHCPWIMQISQVQVSQSHAEEPWAKLCFFEKNFMPYTSKKLYWQFTQGWHYYTIFSFLLGSRVHIGSCSRWTCCCIKSHKNS